MKAITKVGEREFSIENISIPGRRVHQTDANRIWFSDKRIYYFEKSEIDWMKGEEPVMNYRLFHKLSIGKNAVAELTRVESRQMDNDRWFIQDDTCRVYYQLVVGDMEHEIVLYIKDGKEAVWLYDYINKWLEYA